MDLQCHVGKEGFSEVEHAYESQLSMPYRLIPPYKHRLDGRNFSWI